MPGNAPDRRTLADWLALLESRHSREIDLDLSRCGAVYRRLGSPRPARRVMTVAGTNGKGSAVAWSCAILDGLGRRHGAYTSPHLFRFNERLRVQNEDVSTEALVASFEEVEAARGDTSLTYFEFTTLACLLIMSRRDLDTAVLEVGLGGRLDTVNLVDSDLAVITPIGLDHQAYLGEDRLTVGREKAGILRRGKPLVAGEARPPASVLERAELLGCPVLLPGRDYELTREGDRLRFRLRDRILDLPAPRLAHGHQLDNLATALAATLSLHVPSESELARIGPALARVYMPGRLQVVGPAPGFVVDVGHNPLAAATVQAWLEQEGERCVCVLGMLADKDAESVARLLAPSVTEFLCAGLEDGWRAQAGHELAKRVSPVVEDQPVTAFPSVGSAMATARRRAEAGQRVLVFGSFYTAAQALDWLREKGLFEPV